MQSVIADSIKKETENPGVRISLEEARNEFRKNFCAHLLTVDQTKINWNQFELFEHTGVLFFHEMNMGKVGWQENDYNDLLNLIYVSPSDQYYCIENKWLGLIERAGMGKYLFVP